jgi:hypothetical protein
MCRLCLPRPSRRAVLAAGTGLVLAPALRRVPATAGAPAIVPRADWGPELRPTGPVPDEPDVRFVLVHHTVHPNDYGPGDAVGLLTAMYRFHTGPERGWPDIAYNFLVDRFGTVFEGRAGSLAGPKAGDATGGSQGFAQLCAFIGDHQVEAPSAEAAASMAALLAFLGDRHGLDLAPGATATFVSRGSNRRPAGVEVTTPTISGHRDMSATACPGDAAYRLVTDGTLARLATAVQAQPTTTIAATTSSAAPSTTAVVTSTTTVGTTAAAAREGGDGPGGSAVALAATAAAAAAAGVLALRRRRPPRSRG